MQTEVTSVGAELTVDVELSEIVHVVNAGVSVLAAVQMAVVVSGRTQEGAVVTTQVSAAIVEVTVIRLSLAASGAVLPSCELVGLSA